MTDVVNQERAPAASSARQPALEAKGISKAFGHVQALDNVDFELYPAEVVALIGDNGAGKSTLAKILSGIYRKDSGQIYVDGQPVEIRGPRDAERIAGISTVYQDLALVEVRDVASNIYLNMEPTRLGIFINFKKLYADATKVIDALRIDMPSVRVNVGELSGGQRQGVAISRALARGRRIFIMDEPTAALGVEQQHKVNELILNLKAEGKTVVVISHNLEHVFTVADRLIVLRRGKRVGTRIKSQTTKEEVVGLITAAIKGDVTD
ncbi:MAG: sugar ABC transporter ATP-binding protein [Chloroflexi bacterium]|nr:sugar ABC transporter ATP-binding protein [Chloroflexota bacterium]